MDTILYRLYRVNKMYYFHFYVEHDKQNPASRKDRLKRLRHLAQVNHCSCDIESHLKYSTVLVETSDMQSATGFRMLSEIPLSEGIHRSNGVDVLTKSGKQPERDE